MKRSVVVTLLGAGTAALIYHFYNLNEFKKYGVNKLKDDEEAKKKAEYQKFIIERRRKRLEFCERLLKYCACFLLGYLWGVGESELHKMQVEDGAIDVNE